MSYLVKIKYNYNGIFLYILIKIERFNTGKTAKKKPKHVKTGFVNSLIRNFGFLMSRTGYKLK